MADLTMSYEDNLAEADHIIQEQRKRIAELEQQLGDLCQDEHLRIQELERELKLLGEYHETVLDCHQDWIDKIVELESALEKIYVVDGDMGIGIGIETTYCWYLRPKEGYKDVEVIRAWGKQREQALKGK